MCSCLPSFMFISTVLRSADGKQEFLGSLLNKKVGKRSTALIMQIFQ